jgi:hypothetical protein
MPTPETNHTLVAQMLEASKRIPRPSEAKSVVRIHPSSPLQRSVTGETEVHGPIVQDQGIQLSIPLDASGAGLLLCGMALVLLPD